MPVPPAPGEIPTPTTSGDYRGPRDPRDECPVLDRWPFDDSKEEYLLHRHYFGVKFTAPPFRGRVYAQHEELAWDPNARVAECHQAWFEQIDHMMALPDADVAWLQKLRLAIKIGIPLEFKGGIPPPEGHQQNSPLVRQNLDVCIKRMDEYIAMKAAHVCSAEEDRTNKRTAALHVAFKDDTKPRMVFNAKRTVNAHMDKNVFGPDRPLQYEGIDEAIFLSNLIKEKYGWDAAYVKLDLSAAFFSFAMRPEDRHFLRVRLDGCLIEFDQLVFGLNTAPQWVTALLNVVNAYLWEHGVWVIRYLDDFLIFGRTPIEAWSKAHFVAKTFIKFGLVLNPSKTLFGRKVEFLGVLLDSILRRQSVSEIKLLKLNLRLKEVLRRDTIDLVSLQKLGGHLNWFGRVMVAARPFSSSVWRLQKVAGRSYSLTTSVSSELRGDINYWLAHLASWNGTESWDEHVLWASFGMDACTTGFCYFLEDCHPEVLKRLQGPMLPMAVRWGKWTGDLQELQSTSSEIQFGEAFSPLCVLLEWGAALRDTRVTLLIDNKSDTYIFNKRSSNCPRVGQLLKAAFHEVHQHNIQLVALWRKGKANCLADYGSRHMLWTGNEPTVADFLATHVPPTGDAIDFPSFHTHPPRADPNDFIYTDSSQVVLSPTATAANWRTI